MVNGLENESLLVGCASVAGEKRVVLAGSSAGATFGRAVVVLCQFVGCDCACCG